MTLQSNTGLPIVLAGFHLWLTNETDPRCQPALQSGWQQVEAEVSHKEEALLLLRASLVSWWSTRFLHTHTAEVDVEAFKIGYSAATVERHSEPVSDSGSELESPPSEHIARRVRAWLESGEEQVFEDGMESDFSRELGELIRRYGNKTVDSLGILILSEQASGEEAEEALRWLGDIDDPPTNERRRWLLEQSLRCSSRYVRDGAALGLSSLNDSRSLPLLKEAVEREEIRELREDLQKIVMELEKTVQWHLF